ncbi:oxidoreductase [Arthrobacter sp. RIT-PI-e]|uniref:Gfo/Idh/MocA family protein n=1 Tax=Arthrobacter sp. RIT-PI-e TaxID=1681197 RepID=UPI00067638BE|nr:Gfo/Idh/MocA family oxidoreductase [Arthrobacter sp. RIT-PI-e]KNC20123.1 oxidoreductase [Arthrobacter sp. RIT-PI-e]
MEQSNDRIRFAIIGTGWRSLFFQRIARALPERFEVCGVVARSEESARRIDAAWDVPVFRSLPDLLGSVTPEFVVVSVTKTVAPDVIEEAVSLGVPVLAETPPAPDLEGLLRLLRLVEEGAVIQVAEQYHLSPLLNAQLAIAASGRLGTVSQALVAQCHDYHGVSILRRALGVGFESPVITADTFDHPLVKGPSRAGEPQEEITVTTRQITARLDFGDRLGVYEFASDQYFSWIRANRLLIRGERGEVKDTEVRYLQDFRTPMFHEIRRVSAGEGGNLEGQFLRGLVAGDAWVYRNEFLPGRLNDDELAIAMCLRRMSEHVAGGPEFYGLAEAAQDTYLGLLIHEAAETGGTIRAERQPWAPIP